MSKMQSREGYDPPFTFRECYYSGEANYTMATGKTVTRPQPSKHSISLWIALGCGALVIIAILCIYLMPQFFDVAFWKDFVSNISATFLGVLLGIPAALWLDRSISRRREKQEREAKQAVERERLLELLRLLRETLERNREIIERMSKELTPDSLITYNVDPSLLDSTASLKYEIINDLDLNRQLDLLRYELQHLHRKVELRWEIELGPIRAMNLYLDYRIQLVKAIQDTLPEIMDAINRAIKWIDAKLNVEQ
jgi:hypothetical protein